VTLLLCQGALQGHGVWGRGCGRGARLTTLVARGCTPVAVYHTCVGTTAACCWATQGLVGGWLLVKAHPACGCSSLPASVLIVVHPANEQGVSCCGTRASSVPLWEDALLRASRQACLSLAFFQPPHVVPSASLSTHACVCRPVGVSTPGAALASGQFGTCIAAAPASSTIHLRTRLSVTL
jgi:hypothetical protein